MNRLLLLILVAGITFLVIFLLARPEVWKDVWLWLIGLAGPIVKIGDMIFKKIKSLFSGREPDQTDQEAAHVAQRTKQVDESIS